MVNLFEDEALSEADFIKASKILNRVKSFLGDPSFSKEFWVHLQTRLTPAFLLGWVFRRVTHFDLRLVFNNQVWATSELPLIPSRITDSLPKLVATDSDEVVLILNISRNIEDSVTSFVHEWSKQPKAILGYDLNSNQITSAAHALSIALEISRKIKNLIDRWQVRKIHLFGAMPAALATLIGFHLNAICPISIYYLDSSRTQYRLGGTLTNRL